MKKSDSGINNLIGKVTLVTLASKVLGFFREILIANQYGSSAEADVFFMVTGLIALVGMLFTDSISTTFVPILYDINVKQGCEGKIRHSNNLVNLLGIVMVFISILTSVFAPYIVSVAAIGFSGEQFNSAVKFLRIGAPMMVLSSVVGVFTGFLQSERRHLSYSAIGIPFNLIYIIYLMTLSDTYGVEGLMYVSVFAVLIQIIFLAPSLKRRGYRYSLHLDLQDFYVWKTIKLSGPVMIGFAVSDISNLMVRTIASILPVGSISYLNYGEKIRALIVSVFVIAILNVIYPPLSEAASEDDFSQFKKIMATGVNLTLIVAIPATIVLFAYAQPIIRVLFQRGEFTSVDTEMTSKILMLYSLGLMFEGVRHVFARAYYAIQNTKTPFIIAIISASLSIAFSLLLMDSLGVFGLALGKTLSLVITAFLIFFLLRKRLNGLGTMSYLKTGFQILFASLIALLVSKGIYALSINLLLSLQEGMRTFFALALSLSLSFIVYIAASYLLGVREIRNAIDGVLRMVRARRS